MGFVLPILYWRDKRTLVVTVVLFLLVLFFFFSLQSDTKAGMYHAGSTETGQLASETLACSQCHTMHGSQGSSSNLYYDSDPLQPKLLRASSILALCRVCHGQNRLISDAGGGREPPKVEDHDSSAYNPSAGDFMDRNVDNHWNKHNVGDDVSSFEPPGYGGTWSDVTTKFGTTFTCIFCHDQHGNKNYRNLRYNPGIPGDDTEAAGVKVTFRRTGESDCSDGTGGDCDVIVDTSSGSVTPVNLKKYARSNVTFERVTTDSSVGTSDLTGVSAWCGQCHTNFFGVSGNSNMGAGGPTADEGPGHLSSPGGSAWKRHPVQDINIGGAVANLHADSANWSNPATDRIRASDPAGTDGDGDEQPLCLTCHYAHGGGNPNNAINAFLDHSMLVFTDDDGNANILPSGSGTTLFSTTEGRMRNTCNQCHNQ